MSNVIALKRLLNKKINERGCFFFDLQEEEKVVFQLTDNDWRELYPFWLMFEALFGICDYDYQPDEKTILQEFSERHYVTFDLCGFISLGSALGYEPALCSCAFKCIQMRELREGLFSFKPQSLIPVSSGTSLYYVDYIT